MTWMRSLILLVPVLAIYLWWTLYNTPTGERYLKMRTQGPFVPAGDDANRHDGEQP